MHLAAFFPEYNLEHSGSLLADSHSLDSNGMAIWKLTPVDPCDSVWRFSRFCGVVVVRAQNEPQARFIAAEKFRQIVVSPSGSIEAGSPWPSPLFVRCDRVQETDRWPMANFPEVLSVDELT